MSESIVVKLQYELKELENLKDTYLDKLRQLNDASDSSFRELETLFSKKRKLIITKYKRLSKSDESLYSKLQNDQKIVVSGSFPKTEFDDIDPEVLQDIRGDLLTNKKNKGNY